MHFEGLIPKNMLTVLTALLIFDECPKEVYLFLLHKPNIFFLSVYKGNL